MLLWLQFDHIADAFGHFSASLSLLSTTSNQHCSNNNPNRSALTDKTLPFYTFIYPHLAQVLLYKPHYYLLQPQSPIHNSHHITSHSPTTTHTHSVHPLAISPSLTPVTLTIIQSTQHSTNSTYSQYITHHSTPSTIYPL